MGAHATVFVAPLDPMLASLDIEIECGASGAMLSVTNIGNVHAQLRSVVLMDNATKLQVGNRDAFDYLLPAAKASWALAQEAPAATGPVFGVTMLTDQGSFTADVTNSCS